ncbi:hypothetical protein BDF21DRAFT_415969 [Thamnidium elegans]|nr:hypothetical protein BDF21DRAFT_415969 [Thamnidium elegans]
MSTYNEESLMEEFIVLYEQTMLIMNSSSSDLESLIIEQEMESNLLQEAFLFHHSGIFDMPSFFLRTAFLDCLHTINSYCSNERTLIAIEGVYGNKISWPVNQERVEAIQTGFEWPHGQREGAVRRLPNIIGALDGKNVVIESPRVHPEHWRDRKGHFSMKPTAVCDNKCRFIYIRVGDSCMI